MSANPDQAREVARRIAARLSTNPAANSGAPADLSALRSTLSEIRQRLDRIEAQITPSGNSSAPPTAAFSPWTPPATAHPSLDRFDVEEAAVADMVEYFESSKKCDMEPGNKPCDHCSMCSSRGF
jgi:hypothetical protein